VSNYAAMKPYLICAYIAISLFFLSPARAQVGVGTTNPDKSAVLDVSGQNRGFLPPRMTSLQRLGINKPAKGLIVFDNDSAYLFYFDGVKWKGMVNGSSIFGISKLTTVQRLAIPSPVIGDLVFDLDSSKYFYYNGGGWTTLSTSGGGGSGPWNRKATHVILNNPKDAVGIGDTLPDKSAVLDITATDKGILIPRMTSVQRNAIANPAKGLMVFDNDSSYFFYFDGKTWRGLFTNYASGGPWYRKGTDVLLVYPTDSVGVGKKPKFDLDVRNSMNLDSVYKIAGITVLSTKGAQNLFIGQQAGHLNAGAFNYSSGYQAGYLNYNGNRNTFVGLQAGYSNTAGSFNHFIGELAGYNTTISNNNHFDGFAAGYANTIGQGNQFMGYKAGYNNTTASGNFFEGFQAGFTNVTGVNNYFSGYQAGYFNTGSYNHFTGYLAGNNNTSGGSNYFSGYDAGRTNTTGSGNTIIGDSADVTSASLVNAAAIGYNAKVSQSNSMILGNKVNVGIGNTSPPSLLSVGSSSQFQVDNLGNVVKINNVAYSFPSSQATTNGQALTNDGNGNLSWANPISSSFTEVKVTLSSSQIKNLYSSPVTLIAAPGTGKVIDVISIIGKYNFGTTAYSLSSGEVDLYTAPSPNYFLCCMDYYFLSASSTTAKFFSGSNDNRQPLDENYPLSISSTKANPTNGDGTLTFYIVYRIVTL